MRQPYSLDAKIERQLQARGVTGFTISKGEIVVQSDPEWREKICGVITRAKLDLLATRVKTALSKVIVDG